MTQLVISTVNSGSAGEKVGLKSGDIVLEVYGAPVSSRAELIEIMQDEKNREKPFTVLIEREGERQELTHQDNARSLGCYVKVAASGQDSSDTQTASGRFPFLGIIGVVALAFGMYFLFVVHGPTVNIHRMNIGQTFAIVGAIFAAVEWRPKG